MPPAVEAQSLNHWTSREVPRWMLLTAFVFPVILRHCPYTRNKDKCYTDSAFTLGEALPSEPPELNHSALRTPVISISRQRAGLREAESLS